MVYILHEMLSGMQQKRILYLNLERRSLSIQNSILSTFWTVNQWIQEKSSHHSIKIIYHLSHPWLREGLSSFYVRLQIVSRVMERLSPPDSVHRDLGKKTTNPIHSFLMVQTGLQHRTSAFIKGWSLKLYGFSLTCFDFWLCNRVLNWRAFIIICFFCLL